MARSPGIADLSKRDLSDEGLFALNNNFKILLGQILAIQGINTGPFSFKNGLIATNVKLTSNDIPEDPASVLSLEVASKLFSPMAIRQAVVSRMWQGIAVQPFPQRDPGTPSIADTHDRRLRLYKAATLPPGSTYWETDRTVFYINVEGVGWVYACGQMQGTIDAPDLKPTDLNDTGDVGFLFYGIDFSHTWRWDGTVWRWAPGDRGSGEFAFFEGPPGAGWAECNGATVTRSTSDGGVASITLPDVNGVYPKGGSYTGIVQPAVAHNHSAALFTMSAPSSTTEVQSGTGADPASGGHTHSVSGTTGDDDTAQPSHLTFHTCFRL